MKLVEIQQLAHKGYAFGDSQCDYFNPETGEPTAWKSGDSLEWFMHVEIAETFDSEASDEDQIDTAVRALESAQRDLQGSIDSLLEGVKCNVKR